MRILVIGAALSIVGAAQAQEAIEPYDTPVAPVSPARPVAPAQPIDPYAAYPAPPVYGAPPPVAAPPRAGYQQGYYIYPAQPYPPVYYAPPPANCGCCACPVYSYPPRLVRSVRRWDGVRRFSLGAHFGFISLNQQVGKNQVTLGGGGFQLRFRSAGRFGFEMAQSFLHASYWSGAWERNSFPFTVSLMFYVFKNSDKNHFNLYGLGGVGVMADTVHLYDENHEKVSQDFAELEVHAGVGAELRFKWFAIEADARYLHLWRDSGSAPGSYYGNISGAPVPHESQGVQGNLYLSLWF